MKKSILMAMFCMLLAVLFAQTDLPAQTGLFGLSFEQDMGAAHKALLAKGFKENERAETAVTYTNAKIPELISLEVRNLNDDGSVSGWTAKYSQKDNLELESKLKKELVFLHDQQPYYDDYFDEWVWELDNDNAIYFSYNVEDSTLIINYTVYDDSSDWW
jgi:hypothetical protein